MGQEGNFFLFAASLSIRVIKSLTAAAASHRPQLREEMSRLLRISPPDFERIPLSQSLTWMSRLVFVVITIKE